MKKTFAAITIALGLTVTSCNKTYQCVDPNTEIVTGEVSAPSQSKANSMCSTHNAVAKKK